MVSVSSCDQCKTRSTDSHSVMNQSPSGAPFVIRTRWLDVKMRLLWLPGLRKKLAYESFDLGRECRAKGNTALAECNFRRIQTLFPDGFLTTSKNSWEISKLVAASHNYLGMLCLDTGRPSEARPSFDRAIEIRKEISRLCPDDRENQIYLGGALCNRAHSVADTDAAAALAFYEESLKVLRQPEKTCECSYWDEQRQSWWCSQFEARAGALGLLAPQFVDNAMRGLDSQGLPTAQQPAS